MPTVYEGVEDLPEETSYLWGFYLELDRTRQYSEFGPRPITFLDIQAWQNVRQVTLEGWEVDAILQLDNAYFEVNATKQIGTDPEDA